MAHKPVAANPAKMTDDNLTPVMLTGLQSAITAFSATLGTQRAAISGRTGVTAAIAAEIDRADANLDNILDRLTLQFTTGNPNFTTAYASARKVINASNNHEPKPAPPALANP